MCISSIKINISLLFLRLFSLKIAEFMKHKCPNCGEFKYEAGWTKSGCGVALIFIFPIIALLTPGMSSFYGGSMSFNQIIPVVLVSIVVGVILVVGSFLFPQKTITYKCSNCNYSAIHNI